MHVFAPSVKHTRSRRRWSLFQLAVALLGVSVASISFMIALEESGESLYSAGLCFAITGAGAVLQSVSTWFLFIAKPKVRIILTARSIAVKHRGKPARFFKRSACVTYAPEENVFCFTDGSEFSPRKLAAVLDGWHEVPEFIFRHWWPDLDLETMKRELEETYPITRWTLVPYFGAILIMLIVAIVAMIGGMSGKMSKSIVAALVCALVFFAYDWNRRHHWLLQRESERRTVQFNLTAVGCARIVRG